jgi:hypothetical protein
MRAELADDLAEPLAGLRLRGSGEDAADGTGDQRLLGAADVAEHVPVEVDGAALPRTAEHLGDGGLEAGVGVGDHQLDPLQAAGAQRPQERPPERLGLGLAHVQADHLPTARLMHAVGEHQGLVAHPAQLADPLHLGIQP